MIKDTRYIIKRVLIGVGIILVMSFIKSCEVHAKTYILDTSGISSNYWINNTTQYTMVWGTQYNGFASNSLTNIRIGAEIMDPDLCTQYGCSGGIYPGNYLIDFYLMTDGGLNVNSCDDLSHNFQNIDMTSGSWVSNQTYAHCIATSRGYLDGHATLHILYGFETREYAVEFRFLVNRGAGFLSGSNWFRFYMGGIYDYSQDIINDFQNQALTNQIINQNNQIINGQQSIINSQNQNAQQAHQDSQAIQNSINDDSAPANSDFNNAISSVNNSLPTNSTISSLVTMPITFLQKIIDALNGNCQPIVIGELYDYNMTMPCINPSDYIGSIWNIIDVICAGFFAYYFGKKLVLIFHNVTSMKEGGLKEAYD